MNFFLHVEDIEMANTPGVGKGWQKAVRVCKYENATLIRSSGYIFNKEGLKVVEKACLKEGINAWIDVYWSRI